MLKIGITFAIVIVILLHDINLSHAASLRTASDDLSIHLHQETGKVTIQLEILYFKQP